MSVMIRSMDIVPVVGKDGDGNDDPMEQWSPFSVKVQEPGVLRMITTVIADSGTIIPVSMGKAVEPQLKLVPALVFEVNPEAEARKRSFVWLAPGVKLTYPGKLEYRDKYIDENTRNPMFLYEVVSTDKKGA
jgi:hypothetical protein